MQAVGVEEVRRVLSYGPGEDCRAGPREDICDWVPSPWHHLHERFHHVCD